MIEFDRNFETQAKVRFAALDTTRRLINHAGSGGVSASRLYTYAIQGDDQGVRQALGTDLALRRAYRRLLQKVSRFHIPEAVAASTEEFPERHSDGCKIRLQVSRAQPDQLYLIIELSDQRADSPKSLNVFGSDEACETLDLPVQRNGVMQLIIERESPLAHMLADPKSEIFLR